MDFEWIDIRPILYPSSSREVDILVNQRDNSKSSEFFNPSSFELSGRGCNRKVE